MAAIVPLHHCLQHWPDDLFSLPEKFHSIGLIDVEVPFSFPWFLQWRGRIGTREEVSFDLRVVPGMGCAFLHGAEDTSSLEFEFSVSDGAFTLRLSNLNVAIRFDSKLLKRLLRIEEGEVNPQTGRVVSERTFVPDIDPVTGESGPVEVLLQGPSVVADSYGNVDLIFDEGAPALTILPFTIGDSGVIIDVGKILLVLSHSASTVLPSGISSLSRGIVLREATVYFPEGISGLLPDTMRFENFFVGAGGFCGRIDFEWDEDEQEGKTVCGMAFKPGRIVVDFKQNTIVEFSLTGKLLLPYFEEDLDVEVGLTNDGHITVALASTESIPFPNGRPVGSLSLSSLNLGKDGDIYFVELSGTLSLNPVGDGDRAMPIPIPPIAVDGLRISSDGKVSIAGGSFPLPEPLVLGLNGFQVEVNAVGFGKEDEWSYVSFGGGVRFTDRLAAEVSGFKVSWNREEQTRVGLEGIGVSFDIPNTLSFFGDVAYDDERGDFKGAITLYLIAADLIVSARLIIGRADEGYPYFMIELDAPLPAGVPLGSTGLNIYNISGLVAHNMAPDTVEPATDPINWYTDWYQQDRDGDEHPDWRAEQGAFALGVGATLGTALDNGFTLSTKVAFMIAFPGPLVMFQGKGKLLAERKTVDVNPVFESLVVFDGHDKTLLGVLDVHYLLPPPKELAPDAPPEDSAQGAEGMILDASGRAEVFFDFSDAGNWHLYLGQEPVEQRIRATALSVFQSDSYLTLDSRQMHTAVSVGFDETYDFTVASASLKALLLGEAEVTHVPQHLTGDLQFEGAFALEVLGSGLSLSAEAGVHVEVPHPFELSIDLVVEVQLPKPLGNLDVEVHLAWEEAHEPEPVSPVLAGMHVRAYKTTDAWELTIPTVSYDSAPPQNLPVVPLDARPMLSFNRNMQDQTGVGMPIPDVVSEAVNGTRFDYKLSDVALHQWNGNSDVWDAVPNIRGSWQATGDEAGTVLELYGDGPFSFTRETGAQLDRTGTSFWVPYVDSYLAARSDYPLRVPPIIVEFEGFADGARVPAGYAGLTWTPATLEVAALPGRPRRRGLPLIGSKAEPMAAIVVRCSDPIRLLDATIFVPDKQSAALTIVGRHSNGDTVTSILEFSEAGFHVHRLDDDFAELMSISFKGQGVYLCEFSYIRMADLAEAASALAERANALVTQPRPRLDPNTAYRLTVTTVTEKNNVELERVREFALFQTGEPPADLTLYVTEAVLVNGGHPHYPSYGFTIIFNENYVKSLYDAEPVLTIFDANGVQLGVPLPGAWVAGCEELPTYQRAWLGALKEANISIPPFSDQAASDILKFYMPAGMVLPENSLVEAQLSFGAINPWSISFSTSHYRDFSALIDSFCKIPWNETLPADTDMSLLPERGFDEVVYEQFGLSFKPLPAQPELTVLRDAAGLPHAILLRFPEPVDWARVTLTVRNSAQVDIEKVVSRDGAQALLFRADHNSWPLGSYEFDFRYALTQNGLSALLREGFDETGETPTPLTVAL